MTEQFYQHTFPGGIGWWTCPACGVTVSGLHECRPAIAAPTEPTMGRIAAALERIAAALERLERMK